MHPASYQSTNPQSPLWQPPGWGWSLVLAKVVAYVFEVDANNQQVLDDNGNPVPTGLLNVEFMDKTGGRENCPFIMPMAGNSMFMGGLPEIGTPCILAFGQSLSPVILGFLPPGLNNLIRQRQTIHNLQEGEMVIQASTRDVSSLGDTNLFRGAKVIWDTYGRIKIEAEDYQMVIGYLLSGEYTPNVHFVKDPVTGNAVYFQERIKDSVERRVDGLGNAVWQYSANLTTTVEGNEVRKVSGTFDFQVTGGMSFHDNRGNSFGIDKDGKFFANTSGAQSVQTGGSLSHQVGGSYNINVGVTYTEGVIGDRIQMVAGKYDLSVGKDFSTTVSLGDSSEKVLVGTKKISAALGVTIEAFLPGSPCRFGSDNSTNPMALGDVLMDALDQLQQIITTTPPGIGFGNLGAPVPINPAIIAKLVAWKAQYLTAPATNIVSQKTFTERGP